jgi:hypothetical protein
LRLEGILPGYREDSEPENRGMHQLNRLKKGGLSPEVPEGRTSTANSVIVKVGDDDDNARAHRYLRWWILESYQFLLEIH